jgi:hypothetical protein
MHRIYSLLIIGPTMLLGMFSSIQLSSITDPTPEDNRFFKLSYRQLARVIKRPIPEPQTNHPSCDPTNALFG